MSRLSPFRGESVFVQKKRGIFVDFFKLLFIIVFRMDMHNDISMAFSQLKAQIGSRKTVVGAKQLRKAITSGSVFRVYLAENADPAITEPLAALCEQGCVAYTWVRSMTDLGRACGIEVGASAAAALQE